MAFPPSSAFEAAEIGTILSIITRHVHTHPLQIEPGTR